MHSLLPESTAGVAGGQGRSASLHDEDGRASRMRDRSLKHGTERTCTIKSRCYSGMDCRRAQTKPTNGPLNVSLLCVCP